MRDVIIALHSIDFASVRGATFDGFRVRLDLMPDQHGRFRYLVEGNGFSDTSNACDVNAALLSAEIAISGRRRIMARRLMSGVAA